MNNNDGLKSAIGVGLVLVSILLFVFVIRPVSADVSKKSADFETKQTAVLDAQTKLTLLNEEKTNLDLITDVSRNTVENSIPKQMMQDEVIRELIGVSDDNRIELNSISFGKGGEVVGGISVLRVNASFEGGFSDLIRFLEGLETNKREFMVNSISVQLAALEVGGIKRANFSLSMETYYQSN